MSNTTQRRQELQDVLKECVALIESKCGDRGHGSVYAARELYGPLFARVDAALNQATVSEQGEPFGQVTVVRHDGCQPLYHFYPWGQPPYLDNAHECHTVYTAQPAPAKAEVAYPFRGTTARLLRGKGHARGLLAEMNKIMLRTGASGDPEAFDLIAQYITALESTTPASQSPAPAARPMPEAVALEIAGRVSTCVESIREAEKFHGIGSQHTAPAVHADVVATVRIAYDEESDEWLGVDAAPVNQCDVCGAQPANAAPAAVPAVPEDVAKNAARYVWLRDASVPPHNFYLSVPVEFDSVKYQPSEVDAYIDAALLASASTPASEGVKP
jgi:hypothetical protein